MLVGPVLGTLPLGAESQVLLWFPKPQDTGATCHCWGRGRCQAANAVAGPAASGHWCPLVPTGVLFDLSSGCPLSAREVHVLVAVLAAGETSTTARRGVGAGSPALL